MKAQPSLRHPHAHTPTPPNRNAVEIPIPRDSHTGHPLLTLSPLPLLAALCLLTLDTWHLTPCFSQTDRQTKLILPKMLPDAKPELVTQVGHGSMVGSVVFSPDGKKLASGSIDGTVILWDVATGQAEKTLRGHTDQIWAVAFSPDGKKLASGSVDKTVMLWDLTTGQAELTLEGHTLEISSVAFSPDGKKLASGSHNGTVILWDLTTGQAEKTLRGHWDHVRSVAFSPDGKKLASGSEDKTVILWDVATGQAEKTLNGHTQAVKSVAFSPDGKKLAVGSRDGTVIHWDLTTGQTETTFKRRILFVNEVAISPDGKKLASGSSSDTVILWDLTTGQAEKTLKVMSRGITSMAISPDGKKLAWGALGNAVILWDLTTGQAEKTLKGHTHMVNTVRPMAFSPDGKTLALASGDRDNTVILWDLTTGQAPKTLKGHAGHVKLLVFSPDGKKLASGASDNTVILWDVATGQGEKTLKVDVMSRGITSLAISPDGKKLAWGAGDIILWDLTTGLPEKTFKVSGSDVKTVAFSPDGKTLASDSFYPDVILWDVATGQVEKTLSGPHGPRGASSVAFSPDGKKLASRQWKVTVILWDLATEQAEKTFTEPGDLRSFFGVPGFDSVAFSPDGMKLAAGSGSCQAILWDIPTGQVEKTLIGYTTDRRRGNRLFLFAVAFSPDGKKSASDSIDGAIKVRGVEEGRERATLFSLDGGAEWLVTTPEGYYSCSLEASNIVSWRLGDHIFPFDQFSEKYYRRDLVRKALAGEDISNAPPLDGTQIPPNLVFASPAYGAEVTEQNVEVAMETAGVHPIKRVEMTLNGRRVSAEVERALEVENPTENQRTFRVTVPLPPNEPSIRLRAVAYDSELLKSLPAELLLRRSGVQRQPGKLFLISIGVSKYKNTSWNLGYPDADAIAVADTFEKSLSTYFRSVQKHVLVNDQATISNVKFTLRDLKDKCTEEDAVILFIAGHGCMDEQGNYHSIVYDSVDSDLPNTTLSWNDLGSLLGEVRAQALVMFADTCHAGSAIGRYEFERAIGRLNKKAGAAVFSASRGDEASIERKDWGHGAFTKALLEGLGGAADKKPVDKRITTGELKEYLSARVAELTGNQQHPYIPRLDDFPPDTFLCALPGYNPEFAQRLAEKRQPATPTTTAAQKPTTPREPAQANPAAPQRPTLAPPPAALAGKMSEKVQFDWSNSPVEEVFRSLLGSRNIAYRFAQDELKNKRVTMTGGPVSLDLALRLVLQSIGAMGRWEGDMFVVGT